MGVLEVWADIILDHKRLKTAGWNAKASPPPQMDLIAGILCRNP